MVTHAIDRHRWNEITDGAVLQEDGRIVEIGTYRDGEFLRPRARAREGKPRVSASFQAWRFRLKRLTH
jgi:cytosine/adenosine deaminase-related metal-dependent hydrolase